MEIKEMAIEQLEERLAAIPAELEKEDADLDALEQEVRDIKEEMETRKAAEAQRVEIREKVAAGSGVVTEEIHTEERKMSDMEVRNSKEYIDAFAEYIKSNDPTECRTLLTENVSGTVAVPELVHQIVETAWQREGIMSRVRKLYLKGNLKVQFEISAGAATNHTEAANSAVTEETLTLGIVNLVPMSIKKWISISDEVKDMRGEEFLRYIYDELTYQIAKKAADNVIASIEACTAAATTGAPAVPAIGATTISVGLVAEALSKLSDDADQPVVIMNKATWGEFKAAQYAASFPIDPFEGLPVLFNNSITAFTAATTGVSYAYVGDLNKVIANFPAGEEIEIKVDEYTDMTKDLIRILGREYVAVGLVASNAFVKIQGA